MLSQLICLFIKCLVTIFKYLKSKMLDTSLLSRGAYITLSCLVPQLVHFVLYFHQTEGFYELKSFDIE